MTLGALSSGACRQLLTGSGLALRVGPFSLRLRSPLASVAAALERLYSDFPLVEPGAFIDFDLTLEPHSQILNRPEEPQGRFLIDGRPLGPPFHRRLAPAFFEWGFNNAICTRANWFLILHAAVVERAGTTVVMPGLSGSGKSTLCAALVMDGWRLLSDELAIIALDGTGDGEGVAPLCRPISLKDGSIEVIRQTFPQAEFGPLYDSTRKGLVTHLKPPAASVTRMGETAAPPRFVIFPAFRSESPAVWEEISKAQAFMQAALNGVNYEILGRAGFDALGDLIDRADCRVFRYGRVSDALQAFEALPHE